jgi:hypothetical protein
LRESLIALPWWIERLAEAAVGQVRLGDGGRGSTRREPFKGDDAAPENDPALLRRFLAAGRVNARASDLLDEITNTLSTWVRHICETRGIEVPGIGRTTQMACAIWLSQNVGAIACDEAAGEAFSELCGLTSRIETVINRPIPPRDCGPCPSIVDACKPSRDPKVADCEMAHPHRCGTSLLAPHGDTWVKCPKCKGLHEVESLITRLLNETAYMQFTIPELCEVALPRLEEVVPRATLHHWHAKGWLQPKGWRRVRGKTIPLFVLADVRRLRRERAVKR